VIVVNQEYLIKDEKTRNSIHDYSSNKVNQFATIVKNFSVLAISINGDNEDNARVLSKIHDEIIASNDVIVINNGCSEYFNKSLYPIINEFERKLRKLVYLAVVLSEPDKIKGMENIENLEEKDLGTIFEALFTDPDFLKNTKTFINSKSTPLSSKKWIINSIGSFEEKTLWSQLIGDRVIELSENFIDVKDARNDVMHAHDINYSRYKEIKEMYKNINSEFDELIQEFYNPKQENYIQIKDFNVRLAEVMKQLATELSSAVRPLNSQFEDIAKSFSQLSSSLVLSDFKDQLAQLSDSLRHLSQISELTNLDSEDNNTIEKIDEAEDHKTEDEN
jgi:hypothetical protein